MNIPVIEHDLKHNDDWQLTVEWDGKEFVTTFRDAVGDEWADEIGYGKTVAEAITALEIAIQQKEGE